MTTFPQETLMDLLQLLLSNLKKNPFLYVSILLSSLNQFYRILLEKQIPIYLFIVKTYPNLVVDMRWTFRDQIQFFFIPKLIILDVRSFQTEPIPTDQTRLFLYNFLNLELTVYTLPLLIRLSSFFTTIIFLQNSVSK